MSEYVDLIQHIDNNYEDIEDNILDDLTARDEEFRQLAHESSDLDHKYPFLNKVLCGRNSISLSAAEHEILYKYLDIERQLDAIERRAIYFAGHRDAWAYQDMIKS